MPTPPWEGAINDGDGTAIGRKETASLQPDRGLYAILCCDYNCD